MARVILGEPNFVATFLLVLQTTLLTTSQILGFRVDVIDIVLGLV